MPDCGQLTPSGDIPDEFGLCRKADGNVCCVCTGNCREALTMFSCLKPEECAALNREPTELEIQENRLPPKWAADKVLYCNFPAAEFTRVPKDVNDGLERTINAGNIDQILRRLAE